MYGATAGVIGTSRISAAINQAILAIVPNDSCANDYLFYFLQYSMIEVIKKVQGGQPNLNAQIIRSSSIRLPSILEQEKIADVLSAADEEISTLEKQLAAYKQQKLGLMQQLLTGRIRI
jgi:type I restriction enzyme, S subunit